MTKIPNKNQKKKKKNPQTLGILGVIPQNFRNYPKLLKAIKINFKWPFGGFKCLYLCM